MKPIIFSCLLLVAFGCEQATEPIPSLPNITGSWKASTSGYLLSMRVDDNSGIIIGTGTSGWTNSNYSAELTVAGQRVDHRVTLKFWVPRLYWDSLAFSGHLSYDTLLAGKINGASFSDMAIIFDKVGD